MNKITPFLWFDHQAEEAALFYTALFKNSRIVNIQKQGEKVQSVTFHLDGQDFMALNGGPHFKFNEAVSFFVHCESQEEVDYFWDQLSAGGQIQQCGWLKDKFGLSWQIVPSVLGRLMADKDPVKVQLVVQAMLGMKKLDIQGLSDAYAGK